VHTEKVLSTNDVAVEGISNDKSLAFYERGCQEKHLPADGPPGQKRYRGSQPHFRRDELWIRLLECRSFIARWCGLQKLKSERAVLLSTIVLSESQGLLLFQIVRGGIEFIMGLLRVAVVHR
jgi:hypothetical protein